MKQVRLSDVAREAGVSQGTASNVFSRPDIVREEVRAHVLEVAGRLGYAGPDVKGRLLRAGRVNAIGVAVLEPLSYFFDDPWARAMMTAFAEICDARGMGLSLVSARNRQRLAWNTNSAVVDGFVLVCIEGQDHLVELTRKRGLPFVALALESGDEAIPALDVDNHGGAMLAAQHLLDHGHRQFAILGICGNDDYAGPLVRGSGVGMKGTPRRRLDGYLQALGAAGIPADNVPVEITRNDAETVSASLERLFMAKAPPTAILCMADKAAVLAVDWLGRRGLRVPQDVSVVGFDGVPDYLNAAPYLTTVAQPFQTIAERATAMIVDAVQEPVRETIAVTLVTGRTSGPAPGRL